jgi:hypothetical protein
VLAELPEPVRAVSGEISYMIRSCTAKSRYHIPRLTWRIQELLANGLGLFARIYRRYSLRFCR